MRGRGLMIAFDLPDADARNRFLEKAKTKMTLLGCGERSIRLRPSLILTKDEAYLIRKEIKRLIS